MAMITLQNSHSAEVTVLTNNFIDNYMPEANGEFVKVYIYLLRLLSDTSVPFSLAQMADHFFLYRERYCPCPEILGKMRRLLTLTYRSSEDIADITLNVPPVRYETSEPAAQTVSAENAAARQTSAPQPQPAKPAGRSSSSLSPDRVKRTKTKRRNRTAALHRRTISRKNAHSYRDEEDPVLL